ncbi:MAG: saccharopine dehydrogenase, partial [Acidobacteria bacterium]|nr:saccharopine dehydrogenase [Acidobacteriota bacterium]
MADGETMTMHIVVLGAGRVGHLIALDLAQDPGFAVTAVDAAADSLDRFPPAARVSSLIADLSDPGAIRGVVGDADLVVGALPGFLGYQAIQTVIAAGRNMVDISFCPEDPLSLDGLARAQGVTVAVDCGVAPGCSNMFAGRSAALFDEVVRFTCLVGGLPVVRTWPWEYRAGFSPVDVLEEYTRPARFRLDGKAVSRPALTDPELIEFDGIGTLEAFNTDGLRTLLATQSIPTMVEKTLRYPGHIDRIKLLRDTGFLDAQTIALPGGAVSPLEMTSALLFPAWHLGPGVEDLTVMRIEIEGRRQGQPCTMRWDLLDRYDRATGATSMARTTGYTCAAVARALAAGLISG